MSDHTDMMLNRAIASADFDAYREDAKDDRIAALEAENAALKAELEIARHTHSESWKYVVSRAEKSEAQVDALTAELNAKSEQLTALSGHLEAMINANQRVRAEREEASACAEAALQSELEWVSRKALRLYRRAWDVHHLLLHPDDAAEDRVRVLEEQLSETHRKIANQRDANRRLTEDAHRRKAELAAMKSVAHTEARNCTLTANRLIAARQSRARLVRLVRAKNGEFNHLMKLWGEARAWAAAWKRAAKRWQNELLTPRTVTFRVEKDLSQSSIDRRAQRRAERITSDRRAAEAMERR